MIETDGPGGAEIMLLHHAAELQRRGHECVFVGPAEGEGWLRARMRELGLTTEVVGFHRSLDPLAVRDLVRILRRHRIEVVHSHEFMMAVCGAAATTLLRVPHVITMHGGRYYQERRQRRIALRWAARRSPGVVAVSESARQEMASTLRIPSAEVHVIRNGVPAREGDRTGARDSLGLTEDTLLVLAIGSLYPVKGHIVLLRAFARLRETRPGLDAVVAIAGKGGEEAALREYASRVGIEERVRFLGFRADVPDLLAAADVFVMPSRMEGHPLALIEAMFAGRAIVASRVGGIPEILEDGETGIMVEADDPEALASALAELADSPATRVALGKAARAWARLSCRLEAMTDSYETLYRRALSGDG
jgi:glycosyltransferase involved in cell wall biosynthesis